MEYNADEAVPPVDVGGHDKGESVGKHENCESAGEQTNTHNSTLDWEAAAALQILIMWFTAVAETAAASAVFSFFKIVFRSLSGESFTHS